MTTNESSENYSETIYRLSKVLPVVRSVDIENEIEKDYKEIEGIEYNQKNYSKRDLSLEEVANELGYKKSSVSIAMKNLREKKHITVTDAGFIYLTDSGKEIAEMIYERHEVLADWLTRIGVPADIASEDACKLEHVLSAETYQALKRIATQ